MTMTTPKEKQHLADIIHEHEQAWHVLGSLEAYSAFISQSSEKVKRKTSESDIDAPCFKENEKEYNECLL